MITHCKQCKDTPEFPDIATLRKHQWEHHKKMFKQVGRNLIKKSGWTRAQRAKYRATIAKKNGHGVTSVRGFLNGVTSNKHITSEMSALEVLDELKKQRDFMNDIVDMVENLIK